MSREPAHVQPDYGPPAASAKQGWIPPQNIELEMCVLGGIMLEPMKAYALAAEYLAPESFYLDGHGLVFKLMGKLHARGTPPDSEMVLDELRAQELLDQAGGAAVILAMLNSVPSAASVEFHAQKLAEKAQLRALIRASTQIIEECYRQDLGTGQILELAERQLVELSAGLTRAETTSAADALASYWADLAERHARRKQFLKDGKVPPTGTGIPTGLIDVDRLCGGMRKGELTVIAARPSMGKTALALNLLRHQALTLAQPVLLFSLEMTRELISERLLSLNSRNWNGQQLNGISSLELQAAEINTDSDWSALNQSYDCLREAPIHISDSPVNITQLKSLARQHVTKHGVRLVIVDYLQLVSGTRLENRVQEVSEVSRELKMLALDLKVHVVALSQLSRALAARQDKRPQLSDLRESGAIEQDADVIQFLHNDGYYSHRTDSIMCEYCPGEIIAGRCTKCRRLWGTVTELIIAKNRQGPTDTVKLAFIPAINFFACTPRSFT